MCTAAPHSPSSKNNREAALSPDNETLDSKNAISPVCLREGSCPNQAQSSATLDSSCFGKAFFRIRCECARFPPKNQKSEHSPGVVKGPDCPEPGPEIRHEHQL